MLSLIAQANGQSQGNPLVTFLPLILLGVVFYFLLIRPQQKRSKAQQALLANIRVGDDVVTTAGIYGRITAMDDDEGTIELEIAPGTRITMMKGGVSRRLTEDTWDDDTLDDGEGAS
jgi:preprotein translocase subunit YajC